MPFFEINLYDPFTDAVQKIAIEGRDSIEAYEVALRRAKGTTFRVPSPGDFIEIDFKRALVISRSKSTEDSSDKVVKSGINISHICTTK